MKNLIGVLILLSVLTGCCCCCQHKCYCHHHDYVTKHLQQEKESIKK